MPRLRAASAVLVPLVFVAAACGTATAKDAASSTNPLDAVTVTTAKGVPTLTLKSKPFSVTKTESKVITEGKGTQVKPSDVISADYLMVDGANDKQLDSSYGKTPASMDLGQGSLLPGLTKSIVGQKVGSRLLIAMTPADAFGPQGNAQIGAGAKDTILALLDIKGTTTPLKQATGTAVPPKAGLPTVKITPGKPATITVPKTAAPTTLVAQPLIKGTGPVVTKGQTIKAIYTGVIWATGKEFDSSAGRGDGTAQFQIGVGGVIPGWDKSLVGQHVGSRLLLVIPPADGYGAAGQKDAGIKGTDTLVFVVDILSAS